MQRQQLKHLAQVEAKWAPHSAIPSLHWRCFSWSSEDTGNWPLYVVFLDVSGKYRKLSMLQSQSPLPKSVQVCYSVWSSATWNTPFQSFFANYMDLYTYVIMCIYILYVYMWRWRILSCFVERRRRLLNELRVRLGGRCSSVLPMFYRDVEAVEARTLFPPCLLKSSIWAKFLRLAISLSDSVDQKMCRAWHDWNLAGHRWHRHSKRQLKPVSTPGESPNHRNSGDG